MVVAKEQLETTANDGRAEVESINQSGLSQLAYSCALNSCWVSLLATNGEYV